jgi:diketogulonate reductase-like aldo/keto reductase
VSETWAAMERLVDGGKVRHIGVCNFAAVLLRDLLSFCRIRPAMVRAIGARP